MRRARGLSRPWAVFSATLVAVAVVDLIDGAVVDLSRWVAWLLTGVVVAGVVRLLEGEGAEGGGAAA